MNDFFIWWQHIPEHLDPVLVRLGIFEVRYYGLMYGAAFLTTFALALYRMKHEKRFSDYTYEFLQKFLIYGVIGVLIGARLGYVLFYNFSYYLENPLEIIMPFQTGAELTYTGLAGMSFHGGLIGIVLATLLFTRKYKADVWKLADLIAPIFPLGFTFGRIGNFINGELWGRVTELKIGMHFPLAPGISLRHPSQLYEALLEGVLLFFILWVIRNKRFQRKKLPQGFMLGAYLVGYGLMRFIVEFFRQPDAQLGFVFFSFSMGQVLSSIMIVVGIGVWVYLFRINEKSSHTTS